MYILKFLIGGILFVLIYYLSTIKNSMLTALIPAIPVMGLIGLYYISFNGQKDVLKYIKSAIIYFTLYVIMFCIMYYLYYKTRDLSFSCACSCFVWVVLVLLSFSLLPSGNL